MKPLLILFSVLFLVACATAAGGSSASANSSNSLRSEADRARDAGRKPDQVLGFLGVKQGMTVLDVIAAGGYYTEVLSHAVGASGRVYAQNPPRVLRFRGGANDRELNARLFNNRLPNVRRLDRDFTDLGLTANSVDVAITALNFHDVYNNSPELAAGMLQIIRNVLKPGGVLGIIDHSGNPGANNAQLHRIEKASVVAAARQAGFTVAGESDMLANPNDDRTANVFAPGMRGNTDRFLLKLVKPAG